jgi:UTP--glucose-1-phosphate uridylyltransferase
MQRIRKAVIPAAGYGKRFYPLTRAQPKEMLPVLDKPVIHYVVEEAVSSGLDEILIIVGAGKDAIINYFDKNKMDDELDNYGFKGMPDIYFVRQKEQKGLGDAIRYAKNFTGDDDFVVLLGDTIYKSETERTVTSQLINLYEKTGSPSIIVERVKAEKIRDYGIVDGEKVSDDVFRVRSIVEKPDPSDSPSDLGVTGIYILGPYIYECLENIPLGRNGEYQLSDAYNLLVKKMDVFALIMKGKRYDIGTKELWIKTFIEFASKHGGYG